MRLATDCMLFQGAIGFKGQDDALAHGVREPLRNEDGCAFLRVQNEV